MIIRTAVTYFVTYSVFSELAPSTPLHNRGTLDLNIPSPLACNAVVWGIGSFRVARARTPPGPQERTQPHCPGRRGGEVALLGLHVPVCYNQNWWQMVRHHSANQKFPHHHQIHEKTFAHESFHSRTDGDARTYAQNGFSQRDSHDDYSLTH